MNKQNVHMINQYIDVYHKLQKVYVQVVIAISASIQLVVLATTTTSIVILECDQLVKILCLDVVTITIIQTIMIMKRKRK